jgi:hypothetical protein
VILLISDYHLKSIFYIQIQCFHNSILVLEKAIVVQGDPHPQRQADHHRHIIRVRLKEFR